MTSAAGTNPYIAKASDLTSPSGLSRSSLPGVADPGDIYSSLYGGTGFEPQAPRSLEDSGLSDSIVDPLIVKILFISGKTTGRNVAETICLPFGIIEERLRYLRGMQMVHHTGSAAVNDYTYSLTPEGKEYAQSSFNTSGYVGSAPVPLTDYIISVEAQSITAEIPRKAQLELAFRDISVPPDMFDRMGPAINSGAGLFLYGASGNGKSTLAARITLCFGQEIWIPKTLTADGQLIKLFDPAYHEAAPEKPRSILMRDIDRRWIKIRRPTVVAGGELTMDSLEIRHDPQSKVSEAPLQMKSNCGSLLIDDFGRQRVDPFQLLNRWIIPLENRYDYLQLATGKKIQVPFDQLTIFSTNLEPNDLVDEAFLRRIPYKLHVTDPSEEEFFRLFELSANQLGCEYDSDAVEHLLATHYRPQKRALRRCHPRDLLIQISNYCRYADVPFRMSPNYFDVAVENYFTIVRTRTS